MVRIESNDRVFVLTGAGISAESGLPTFRGANDLWRGHRVEDVASPIAWERDPRMVWTFYSERRRKHRTVESNPGHHALVQLERALNERFFLCTQNVDRLHEQAGSERLVHMHGKVFQSRCERECGRPSFDDDWTLEGDAEIPRCPCGGRIRPHICWFGETPFELERIFAELGQSSIFLAVGTSGVVEPAASFVRFARRAGRVRTFYVGPEEPANATSFDEVFVGPSGEVLPKLFGVEQAFSPAGKTSE